jgi:U3 small nucleolar ribonucleoprotein component
MAESSDFQRFDASMRKILSISKEELEKREKNWQRRRKRAKAKKKRASS